jgi:hypothetical protein
MFSIIWVGNVGAPATNGRERERERERGRKKKLENLRMIVIHLDLLAR